MCGPTCSRWWPTTATTCCGSSAATAASTWPTMLRPPTRCSTFMVLDFIRVPPPAARTITVRSLRRAAVVVMEAAPFTDGPMTAPAAPTLPSGGVRPSALRRGIDGRFGVVAIGTDPGHAEEACRGVTAKVVGALPLPG